MSLQDFKTSLLASSPPDELTPLLEALWFDAKGDWTQAHVITQDVESPDGAWVHAYLHRKEGDPSNARYWYARAGRKESTETLEKEWEQLCSELLAR